MATAVRRSRARSSVFPWRRGPLVIFRENGAKTTLFKAILGARRRSRGAWNGRRGISLRDVGCLSAAEPPCSEDFTSVREIVRSGCQGRAWGFAHIRRTKNCGGKHGAPRHRYPSEPLLSATSPADSSSASCWHGRGGSRKVLLLVNLSQEWQSEAAAEMYDFVRPTPIRSPSS